MSFEGGSVTYIRAWGGGRAGRKLGSRWQGRHKTEPGVKIGTKEIKETVKGNDR